MALRCRRARLQCRQLRLVVRRPDMLEAALPAPLSARSAPPWPRGRLHGAHVGHEQRPYEPPLSVPIQLTAATNTQVNADMPKTTTRSGLSQVRRRSTLIWPKSGLTLVSDLAAPSDQRSIRRSRCSNVRSSLSSTLPEDLRPPSKTLFAAGLGVPSPALPLTRRSAILLKFRARLDEDLATLTRQHRPHQSA